MFEAEFIGKLPELANREDYLTSCIFGALKYLPPQEGLFPLIGHSLNYSKNRRLSYYIKNIYHSALKVEYYFWPKSSRYGEPDIVIILKEKTASFIIPIEIKYFSGKHDEGEDDQLARYFLALDSVEGRKTFNKKIIREFCGELLAMVYITQYEASHDIEQSLKILEGCGIKNAHNKIFHLKWQDVSKILGELIKVAKKYYSKYIYKDILDLLMYKNLLPFDGFSPLPCGFKDLMLQIPIFFESGEKAKYVSFGGFSKFPYNLSLEHKNKIYYGG